ncbi:MAG TPA: hypothetical protein VGD14_21285 [bacterium]
MVKLERSIFEPLNHSAPMSFSKTKKPWRWSGSGMGWNKINDRNFVLLGVC